MGTKSSLPAMGQGGSVLYKVRNRSVKRQTEKTRSMTSAEQGRNIQQSREVPRGKAGCHLIICNGQYTNRV